MTILKTDKVKPNHRMVGALFPIEMHDYLILFTLAKRLQKTDVIKELFLRWMKSQKETEKDLVKIIIQQANEQWQLDKEKKRQWKSFTQFIGELRTELDTKKLQTSYIEQIVKGVKE